MDLNEQGRTGTPVQTRHFWELARADFLMRLLRRRIGGGEGTLLDFGCGDGYLLRRMAAELPRWRFRAVDAAFDAGTMRELETAAPGRIRAERALDVAILPEVSCVTLFDVLEHLEDDAGVLKMLAGGLPRGAVLLITVPAGSRLYGEHDRRLRHFRRYDRADLAAVLGRSGLEVLECRSFFCSLYPVRLLELARGSAGGGIGGGAISPGGLNALLHRLFYCEAVLEGVPAACGLHLPGLSLEAVCRISVS